MSLWSPFAVSSEEISLPLFDDGFCVAMDSACDLPADFIQQHNIRVLPIFLKLGGGVFADNRDPRKTVEFYKEAKLEKIMSAESFPASAAEISKILENELALQFDKVLAITISSTRSQVHKNVCDAVLNSQRKFKELRGRRGLSSNFRIKVLDSLSLFTGQGVLVHEAIRLLQEEQAGIEVAALKLEWLRERVRAFLLPESIVHLKNRARTKADSGVDWLSLQVGSLLNVKPIFQAYQGNTAPVDKAMGFESGLKKIFGYATAAIENGLSANVIVMSYAGDLNEIKNRDAYQDFVSFAEYHAVPTLLSVMSATAAINVGPGCFSLAYAD